MHSTFHHAMAVARIADLHYHAARERTAKAAVRAHRAQPRHRTRPVSGHAVSGLMRRALTLSGGRSPSQTR
jgi:hypothetical protein